MGNHISEASVGATAAGQVEINVAVVISVASSRQVGTNNETSLCLNGWIVWIRR